jgi:hypothetical protein
MADDPLETLRDEGRRRVESDRVAAARAREARQVGVDRETQQRLRDSVSPFARWIWWVWGGIVAFGIFGGVAMALAGERFPASGGDAWLVMTLAVAGLPLLVAHRLRGPVGARDVAREEAWVRGLPFRMEGYFEALRSIATEGTATLTVVFEQHESGGPDDETFEALLYAVGWKATEPRGTRTKVVTRVADFGEGSAATNAHLAAWVHEAVGVLAMLHERHPIEVVEVAGF